MNYLERTVNRTRTLGLPINYTAEEAAAEYAATLVGGYGLGGYGLGDSTNKEFDQQLIEAYLRQLKFSGATFDFDKAARLAWRFLTLSA